MSDNRVKPEGWTLQLASDIVRDGLGAELVCPAGTVSCEIFRCDADHTISKTVWASVIPVDVYAWFRAAARRKLGEIYEDGSPVDWDQLP